MREISIYQHCQCLQCGCKRGAVAVVRNHQPNVSFNFHSVPAPCWALTQVASQTLWVSVPEAPTMLCQLPASTAVCSAWWLTSRGADC